MNMQASPQRSEIDRLSTIALSNPEIRSAMVRFAERVAQASPAEQTRMLAALRAICSSVQTAESPEFRPPEESRDSIAPGEAQVRTLIKRVQGVFVGRDELVRLGTLPQNATIPELPNGIEIFLKAKHPLRVGTIARHVILAFDPPSNEWVCIDRGRGGKSDIVLRSLGRMGRGMTGYKQDKLLQRQGSQIQVAGAAIISPSDSEPIKRTLNAAIALHFRNGLDPQYAPFRGIWGRTADTTHAAPQCRVLLGLSDADGVKEHTFRGGDATENNIGLLACWNLKGLDS